MCFQELSSGVPDERAPLPTLPTIREAACPFDPPVELARIREQAPLCRLRFPDSHVGWLATGYAVSRAVLADPRVSSRYELMHSHRPGVRLGELPRALPGDLTGIDPPEHTGYRKKLTGKFTVRRMRLLTDRVQQITNELLDAMRRQGPPIDLVQVFAQPLPALMICELLGVPYSEHEYFQRQVAKMTSAESGDVEAIFHAGAELNEYIRTLVVAKRAKPTDDLLSDLAVTTDLSDEELAGIGGFLLGAGFDTTTNMLSLGAFALLDNPEQLAIMRDEPENTDQAVEELMRYLSIAHTTSRTATEDIEIAGQTIKAGDTVVVSLQAANRDPKQFPDPDVLDLRGKGGGHLGFGHGVHQCLGQQLARVEMRTALPALLRRFPTLRLAIPPGQVPLRGPEHNIYGLTHLPVTWQS